MRTDADVMRGDGLVDGLAEDVIFQLLTENTGPQPFRGHNQVTRQA